MKIKPEMLEYFDCEAFDYHYNYCFPWKNNFIRQYLENIPLSQKLEKVNQIIPIYTDKKMKIKESQGKGLGIFMEEQVYRGDKLFSYNLKKIISTRQINQAIFFQNSLTINHRKLRLNQRKLQKQFEQSQAVKRFLIIINLFYHFCRIKNSFLLEDLIALPLETMLPIFKITPYEFKLFKFNLKKDQIQKWRKNYVEHYEDIKANLEHIFSIEQYVYYFQRESMSLDEFLYMTYIIGSRPHKRQQDTYLYPVLHYANQITDIKKSEYVIITEVKKQQSKCYSTFETQENSEFLINYGYDSIQIYAFQSGFIPNITNLECNMVQILDVETANHLQIAPDNCLSEEIFFSYIYVIVNEYNEELINQCIQNNYKLQNLIENYPESDQIVYLLYSECYVEYHQNKDIWINVQNQIDTSKRIFQLHMQEIQNYMAIRLKYNKDYYIAELLLNYQKYYYDLVIQTEYILNESLKLIRDK